ncbi:MAG: gliding motility-associated protein GldE [Crocinitomicaceae bacterium]|nr:gliding motility-associated protein GldE [Crocinitomicaceae bacterium]
MEIAEPPPHIMNLLILKPDGSVVLFIVIVAILLVLSALVSGAESAFFSLSPQDTDQLKQENSPKSKLILDLLNTPKELLATILIANNFLNVGIVILSSFIINHFFPVDESYLRFFIEVIGITLLILLWGEVIPKIFAVKNATKVSRIMARPLNILYKFPPIYWIANVLIKSSKIFSGKVKATVNISSSDLEQAVAITKEETAEEDHKILEGIVKFGKTEASQIMKPRVEVAAVDVEMKFSEIKQFVLDSGFSRIPVYKETADQVTGILYIKDLLPYLNQDDKFNWQSTLRKPFFIPENKKINDLLQDFKNLKMHLSIVVDEYGGASGIVTLEDILEEIVGDITDEFDEEDLVYSKVDEHTFIFEGRTSLMDFYKVSKIENDLFESLKGEAETLGGFVIEQAGRILKNNEFIVVGKHKIIVESSDKRRIKTLKVISNHE